MENWQCRFSLNIDPSSDSHMTPCSNCSWTCQGQTVRVTGVSYTHIQCTHTLQYRTQYLSTQWSMQIKMFFVAHLFLLCDGIGHKTATAPVKTKFRASLATFWWTMRMSQEAHRASHRLPAADKKRKHAGPPKKNMSPSTLELMQGSGRERWRGLLSHNDLSV